MRLSHMGTDMLLHSRLWWDIRNLDEPQKKRAINETGQISAMARKLQQAYDYSTQNCANNSVLPILPRLLRNIYQPRIIQAHHPLIIKRHLTFATALRERLTCSVAGSKKATRCINLRIATIYRLSSLRRNKARYTGHKVSWT